MKLLICVQITSRPIRGKGATPGELETAVLSIGEHWTEKYLLAVFTLPSGGSVIRTLLNSTIWYAQVTYVKLEDRESITNSW